MSSELGSLGFFFATTSTRLFGIASSLLFLYFFLGTRRWWWWRYTCFVRQICKADDLKIRYQLTAKCCACVWSDQTWNDHLPLIHPLSHNLKPLAEVKCWQQHVWVSGNTCCQCGRFAKQRRILKMVVVVVVFLSGFQNAGCCRFFLCIQNKFKALFVIFQGLSA